ncbi:homoserine kinase [bacterium]|nr:homoserine kinase [bacterium]MCI0566538.1 homoserine kinase [bacterium]
MNSIAFELEKTYGMGAKSINPLAGGVINTNYLAETAAGFYVFKIYNLRTPEEAAFELEMLEHLAAHSFPAPRVVRTTDGDICARYDGKPAALLRYIAGETGRETTPAFAERIGNLLGIFHAILADYPQKISRQTWEPQDIRNHIREHTEHIKKKGFPDAEEFTSFIRSEFEELVLPRTLPQGITHQDVKPDNVVFDESGGLHFIDFDNAYRGALLYDIMTPVIWTCFNGGDFSLNLFERFISGYENKRHLAAVEKKYFFDALRFRLLREAFVWPMRFLPELALRNALRFRDEYRSAKREEDSIMEIINNL